MGSVALADDQITVSGTATVQIEPDMVIVSLGVTAISEEVLLAQQEANAVINQVVDVLTGEMEIAPEDIATTQYYINENYEYNPQTGRSEKKGYSAVVTLSVCVRDLEKAGAVIDAAMKAGANGLSGVEFMSSDQRDARDQALTLAVQDGMRKAKVIASAAGIEIPAFPSSITENGSSTYRNSSNSIYMMDSAMMESAAGGTKLQSGMLNVTANVTLVYEID
jgi:uncharacterized protein YggE